MAAATVTAPSSQETWDDDLVFQRAKDIPNIRKSESDDLRWSMSTSQDWRPDPPLTHQSVSSLLHLDPQPPTVRLQEWAEPGPATPPKHTVAQTENWDDDFVDKNSPARHPPSRSPSKPPRLPEIPEPENWDDDLDGNRFVSPRKDQVWDSSDDEDGIDFADQEDKTVVARPRKGQLNNSSPPPPVPSPPLPLGTVRQTFPGSPTMSVFSIPSGRDSGTYSSLAHLPLRGGSASALAMLPPSPPAQKARRRLRKKSRPPDSNVFELLDIQHDSPPSSPPQPSSPVPEHVDLPPSEISSSSKSSILSRLGSVKKWGVRKRLTSPGPSDAAERAQAERDATPRAAASQFQSPSLTPSWFFRSSETPDSTPGSPLGSANLELKHERSFRHLRALPAVDSPTKKGKLRGAILGQRSRDSGSASTPDGSPPSSPRRPRRPTSMQVPAATPPVVPRHASYGARSVSRSTSHVSIDEVNRECEGKGKEKEGHRGFMNGVRRISLVSGKKHKRTKSTATVADGDETQLPPIPQVPPPTMVTTPSISSQLLPPIELQPPSPPRGQESDEPRKSITSERSVISTSGSLAAGVESLLLQPSVDAMSSPPTLTPRPSLSKNPSSPQAASLGRATQPLPATTATGIVPRRNSLGDLKIPARISQAQVGLKRDLGMVRDFAAEVENLKELQGIYQSLAVEAQSALEREQQPTRDPPRATSPTFFNLPRPRSRARSNTSPNPTLGPADPRKQFAASFFHLDHKYKISWECAELLIELGGGPPAPTSQPTTSALASAQQFMHPGDSIGGRRSRERAITLAGDETTPPVSMSLSASSVISPPEWRASTGRNDLSQRQLFLLRDMLNKSDSSPTMLANLQIPEEGAVNRNWRWGEATSSTITLPSEGSTRNSSPAKKRRYSRIRMSGLRDMLRSLTRGHQPTQPPLPLRPPSSASTSASSTYDDQPAHEHSQHRPAKSSTGPDDVPPIRASSPFSTAPSLTYKSPRRPSIASIFRFAQKTKPSPPGKNESKPHDASRKILHSYSSGSDLGNRSGTVDDDEEDWDHIDSVEDLDAAARALGLKDVNGTATVRGRRSKQHPYEPEKKGTSTDTSQSSLSLWAESPSTGSRSQVSLATTTVAVPATSSLPRPQLPASTSTVTQSTYMRPTRLSNVEEMAEALLDNDQGSHVEGQAQAPTNRTMTKSKSPRRTSSRRRGLTGSVRSAPPPTPLLRDGDKQSLTLSLTPETIRPLLENAREVHARCTECVDELRALLAAWPS
ncbi:hypothetical protein BC827DRAFT_1272511 [Russula dissimulans]|nr:hypothetical protein BC827DRAFT_1272511 [Russula dissimulans]